MFDAFRVRRPFYPLVGLAVSVITLIAGMLFSKSLLVFLFIGILIAIYTAFGLAKAVWKMGAAALILGLVIGSLAYLTSRNAVSFWQTAGRALLLGVCAVPMVSIPPAMLTRCLTQLKCPRVLTLGMLVTIRFIPILISEIKRILEAMKTRGVHMAWYRPDCLYRAFFIPLIMRIISISDTLSLSLETRGFTLDEKAATVYHPVSFSWRDFALLFCVLITVAGMGVLI